MAFCGYCGEKLNDDCKFCHKCGNPVTNDNTMMATNALPVNENNNQVEVLKSNDGSQLRGESKSFPLNGSTLTISRGMDLYNYFRKMFEKIAKQGVEALKAQYVQHITNLDAFLMDFSGIYFHYRRPIIEIAVRILTEAGIYDVSMQTFEEIHTRNYCLCGEDVKVMIESFDLTIQENQYRKERRANMLPGMVFGGSLLGSLVKATAYNVIVTNIAEASIRNANVTKKQRKELYDRINVDGLMYRAYLDYWNVYKTLASIMRGRGVDVWEPNSNDLQMVSGLFQNICSGNVPEEKIPQFLVMLLEKNPYVAEYYKHMIWRYGRTPEVNEICEYFGF